MLSLFRDTPSFHANLPISANTSGQEMKLRKCQLKQACQHCVLNASGVIVIVSLSLAKNCAKIALAGLFLVLKVLVFDAVGVPHEVALVSKSKDEGGPNVFLS